VLVWAAGRLNHQTRSSHSHLGGIALKNVLNGEVNKILAVEEALAFKVSDGGKDPASTEGPLVLDRGHGALVTVIVGIRNILDGRGELGASGGRRGEGGEEHGRLGGESEEVWWGA